MGVDVLPPAVWPPYMGSSGATITVTSFQSTSSSSATTIGSEVRIPWPPSALTAQIETVPSGAILTKAFGAKPWSEALVLRICASAVDSPRR